MRPSRRQANFAAGKGTVIETPCLTFSIAPACLVPDRPPTEFPSGLALETNTLLRLASQGQRA